MALSSMTVPEWKIERRANGVLIVRIPSKNRRGQPLPDAVFSFRAGDPQYTLWEERYKQQISESSNGRSR
jgi:hypothetical protein